MLVAQPRKPGFFTTHHQLGHNKMLVAQTEYYHAYSKNARKKFSQASDLQIVQHVVLWQLATFVWDANMRMLCSSTRKNSCEPVHMQLPPHFSSANSL